MDYMDDDIPSIRRTKKAREMIYSMRGNVWPEGEKQINPQRAQTANDYYSYLHSGIQSFHVQSGAHLAMLEHEEHKLGGISYPEGHPRREHVEAGRYGYGEPISFHDRRSSSGDLPAPTVKTTPTLKSVPSTESVRTNRWGKTCDNCGEWVKPGAGKITRGVTGYSTQHNPSCNQ
jgi:hypothetical protein